MEPSANTGHENEAIEHGHTGNRDKTHGGRDREGNTPQGNREDTACERERHGGEDRKGQSRIAERREQRRKNENQANWNDHLEPADRLLKILELAPPLKI